MQHTVDALESAIREEEEEEKRERERERDLTVG
jgi:hypothetical protein